jgi:RHS repeat-associated protein
MVRTGSGLDRAWRRLISRVSLSVAALLVVEVLSAFGPDGAAGGAAVGSPPAPAGEPVPVHAIAGHAVKIPSMPAWRPRPVSWPAAGSGTSAFAAAAAAAGPAAAGRVAASPLAGATAGSARAGSLPVWAGPPGDTGPVLAGRAAGDLPSASPVSRVSVSIAPQATSASLGLHGAVLTVTRADGAAAAGRVHVSLDYASFAGAYGAGYGSRQRLVALPSCALTTPAVAACRQQAPLRSANDAGSSLVGADVILPAETTAAPSVVLAATAASQGPGGNFGAEPLSEMDQWVTGGSSGAYAYSYDVEVPPVPGGLQPSVSLDYGSQAVDGLNASTNNQASWIGDGWTYAPGFVEVDYPTCATNALAPDTLDLCAPLGEVTVTLNGTTTPLVVTSSGGTHPEADGAQQVLRTANGGYEVIEPDGTQYWFGLNQLPGWASGDAATNSVWTVPVYNNGFTTGAWRYMLDYVVDARGDAIAYFYNTQTNSYAESGGAVANGAYTQGGALARIEYGLRAGSIYTQIPAAQVSFTTGGTVRSDAPTDLACAQGAACSVTGPTFWTSYALTGIATQALENGSLQNVDSWALAQTYPATGDATTSPNLWLSSIARTGRDGTSPVTLQPVSFSGTAMPNLAAGSPGASRGNPLITRYRLSSVTNETGAVTAMQYSAVDPGCAAGTFPRDSSNVGRCYPDFWLTDPLAQTQQEDWFNLYDVTSVTDTDTTGGGPPMVTSYTYAGPAWHYDNDTVSRSANWTWDQWRGFRSVTTQTGAAPDPVTQVTDTYLQGKSQDQSDFRSSGGIVTNGQVNLTSSHGDVVEDKDQYAGMRFEQTTYNGAGTGNQVEDVVWLPFTSAATATNSSLNQAAFMTGTTSTHTFTALAGGGSRESTVTATYNGNGQVLTESDVPDTADASQSTCTANTYVVNTNASAWIVELRDEERVTSGACGSTGATTASDSRYQYDGGAFGTAPTHGNVTQESHAGATASGATVSETSTYDAYGRVLTTTDADSRTTSTTYTPATGAEPTSEQVTDPAGLVTTTTYDPARDVPLTVTDPAGYQTTDAYDALGRVIATWTPGNAPSGPPVDRYSYAVNNTAPSVTTEQVEVPGGGYRITDTIADSQGRIREVQAATAGGGTDVTDVTYDSDGRKALSSDPYPISGAPTGTLVAAASSQVPSQTGYVYDGAGRTTREIAYKLGAETWETDTTYGGGYVTVVPPPGGTSSTTFTDGRGVTTAIYQYHAGVPADPSDPPADYDRTGYTYTTAGQLARITDAAGDTWNYTYDQLDDQLTQADPDAGTATSVYDGAGQLISVTDARGKQVSYTYDAAGRRTAEYDTTGGAAETSADQLAAWTYDTLARGRLTSSTAYRNGAAYTEAVTGYNALGLPTGDQVTIPSAQGALAGTYTTSYAYAPTGEVTSYTDSAAGGLPAETVTTGYDAAGNPSSLSGASTYVGALSYTNLGQPQRYAMGTTAMPTWITDAYDPQTGRLTERSTQTGTTSTTADDRHYSYDPAGNVTSQADTPSGAAAAADVQCFQYDYLGRLVQAWAQGSAGCGANPSAAAEGGAAPYWNTYSYDTIGNLTGITATAPSGTPTTTADTYPATGSPQPHAVTASSVTTGSVTASTGYAYDAAGHLTGVTGPSQTLTWNAAGQLVQDAITPAGGTAQTSTYVYDADGTLLLTADPGTTTLFLGDEELSLDPSTGLVTGTRYYSLDGVTVASRTGASTIAYLARDQQGTDSVAIDSATLAVTRRWFDPYGNPRGPAPASFPAGERGFVGGTADSATGLTNLGAREYRPGTGSFISPDPVLKPYDPQDLNPYAYAEGNPATDSDPTGTMRLNVDGCVGSTPAVKQCLAARNKPKPKPAKQRSRGTTANATSTYLANAIVGNCAVVSRICSHRPKITPARRASTTGSRRSTPANLCHKLLLGGICSGLRKPSRNTSEGGRGKVNIRMSGCVRYLTICIRAGTGGLNLSGRPRKDKPWGGPELPNAPGRRGVDSPLGAEDALNVKTPHGLTGAALAALLLAVAIAEYCREVCNEVAHPRRDNRPPPPGVWCPGAPGCFRRTP